jgi:hypothetical protein
MVESFKQQFTFDKEKIDQIMKEMPQEVELNVQI